MLKMQKKYINYIESIENEIRKTSLSDSIIESFNFENTVDILKNTELIVPVIGAFSAGKSSLINSFLGDKKLPEKITPETALATELRYSDNERIEAINGEDDSEIFSIDDIEEIKARAGEFKYLKMYLKNDNLKNIEPLVLVDMPGFESPLDLHNQAIMEYINKGVHYIVLTSVEDGTITKSMTRELENIFEFKREFSFFLSKTNLKPKNEVVEIKKKVEEQLEEYFDKSDEVGLIDDNGGESLKHILSTIDPEQLFEHIFLESLRDNFFSIKEAINVRVSSLSKNKKENGSILKQLEQSLTDTNRKKEQLIEESKNKYSDTNINIIVENVGRDLSNSLDELVNVGMTSGSSTLSNVISEIVKSSLIKNVKGSIRTISNDIIDDFSVSLSDLNNTMSSFTLSENWLEDITFSTKKIFEQTSNGLNNIIKNREKNSGGKDGTYKAITTILGLTTTVLNPVLEILIVFLPNILSSLFGENKKRQQKEELQQTILTTTIPAVKRNVRAELPKIFNTQILEMIESISNQFEKTIKDKLEIIKSTQEEINEKNINIEITIEAYKNTNDNITTLANNTLYKG